MVKTACYISLRSIINWFSKFDILRSNHEEYLQWLTMFMQLSVSQYLSYFGLSNSMEVVQRILIDK